MWVRHFTYNLLLIPDVYICAYQKTSTDIKRWRVPSSNPSGNNLDKPHVIDISTIYSMSQVKIYKNSPTRKQMREREREPESFSPTIYSWQSLFHGLLGFGKIFFKNQIESLSTCASFYCYAGIIKGNVCNWEVIWVFILLGQCW